MLLLWLHALSLFWHGFYVFHYLTIRAIVSALTAFACVLFLCPAYIRFLSRLQVGQTVRVLGPTSHYKKSGTPTMGGVLILFAVLLTVLVWANLRSVVTWVVLFTMLGFGAIGLVDDYRKVVHKNTRGLSARWKFLWQSLLALIVALILYFSADTAAQTALLIPFLKTVVIPLGVFFVPLTYLVIVGSSNAVNLTDGLDGLALLPIVLIGAALGVFAYLSGHFSFAHYLGIPYLAGVGECVIFCSALAGAGLGFLWYNTYPAEIFMGDVGSLGLGAALGVLAVVVRQELVFFLMSGVFVIETLSVILQVLYFKSTGRRLFKMAPLHHHFELKGWPEPRVIVRFWIVTVALVLMGLATLKLR